MSSNVELVRAIFEHWERGDWFAVTWADPELEFVIADGPAPASFVGVDAMVGAWRDFLATWSDYATAADEYRELDDGRVFVVLRPSGRGKASGVDLSAGRVKGANVFDFRDGLVTRLAIYFDHRDALGELGLES